MFDAVATFAASRYRQKHLDALKNIIGFTWRNILSPLLNTELNCISKPS